MEKYELLYILPAKYTEAEMNDLAEKVKGIITTCGATVVEQHHLGRRRLAYPIKHIRNGNYFLVWLEADSAGINKLNETLRLSADVLRHIIVRRDARLTKIPNFTEEEAPRRDREDHREDAPRPIMQQQPLQPVKEKMSMEELDKQLDKMLTEEVI